MKVTKDKVENSLAYLTVEMDPSEVEASMEKTYRKLVRTKKVPGFRIGKTPRAIFERYYTRQSLLEDALDILVPEAYRNAVKEQEIEPIADPQIQVTQTEPVVFKAVVPLKPVIKLGDYKSIRIAQEPPKEITEQDIDNVIEAFRHEHATWEPVEREVRSGDMLTLDIWSEVEGKPYINQKSAQYQANAGADFPVKGFAEQLIGMKKDEEKEFKLSFAADDARKEFAGKEAQFKIRINEIKEEKLPELNDELAKIIDAESDTVTKLREKVASRLKEQAAEKAKTEYEDKVIGEVTAQAQVEFPEILTDTEIHRLINQRFRTRQQFEDYMNAVGKTEEEVHEELHAELHDLAETRVKRSLVLGQIADEEKIEVTAAEIDADIEKMLEGSSGESRESTSKLLNRPEFRETISDRLLSRKVIDRLLAIARGEAEANKEEPK